MKSNSVELETNVSKIFPGKRKCTEGEFLKPFDSTARQQKFILITKVMFNITNKIGGKSIGK